MIELDRSWNDEFTAFGYWWLPDDEAHSIPGTLRYAGGEICVELLGQFTGNKFAAIVEPKRLPKVLGRAQGKLFTLLECRTFKSSWHSESEAISSIDAKYAVEGAIFESTEKVESEVVDFRCHHMEEWLADSPVERQHEGEGDDRVFIRKYRLPKSQTFALSSLVASLTTQYAYRMPLDGFDDFLTHRGFFSLKFGAAKPLAELVDVSFEIASLLSFLMGQRTGISHLSIEVRSGRQDEQQHPRYARVYARHYPWEGEAKLNWLEQRFTFSMIGDRFEDVANRWLERSDQLKTSHDLHSGAEYGKNQPIRFRFLNLVHALESFDRHRGGSTYISEEEYQDVCRVLTDAIPTGVTGGHRESLKNRIKYGNEISLRNRLAKMLDELPEELLKFICSNKKAFAGAIADTRNYFSHYTDELREKAVTDMTPLYWLTERMRVWVSCVLMLEFGFEAVHVAAALQRCERSQWLMTRALEY